MTTTIDTTNYSYNTVLLEGQVRCHGSEVFDSWAAEGDVPIGRFIVEGTEEGQASLPSGAGGKYLGVSTTTPGMTENYFVTETVAGSTTRQTAAIEDKKQLTSVRQGAIGVFTETAISTTDSIFIRHTADGDNKSFVGVIRNDDDTASGNVEAAPAGVEIRKGAAAGGVAEVILNMP